MTDQPMSYTRYRRERLMEMWAETGAPMSEIREAYPDRATRIEWEEMLDRCAERGMVFPYYVLLRLSIQHQNGINRRSKGASMPPNYVIREMGARI